MRTYGFSTCFLVLDPRFVPISLSSPARGIENVKERLFPAQILKEPFESVWPPLEAGTRFAFTIWE
jgi:hypothetical protein